MHGVIQCPAIKHKYHVVGNIPGVLLLLLLLLGTLLLFAAMSKLASRLAFDTFLLGLLPATGVSAGFAGVAFGVLLLGRSDSTVTSLGLPSPKYLALPKSISFRWPLASSNKFSGLRSRWITCRPKGMFDGVEQMLSLWFLHSGAYSMHDWHEH